jgi:RpiB/LacA/LacB family sugar-phosphate isomerase
VNPTNNDRDAAVVIGSDHAGWELKEAVKHWLLGKNFTVTDVSEPALNPADDYPKYAFRVARAVAGGSFARGIVLCGTGIGASIAANRVKGVRAALCLTEEMAVLARKHNDSNVLVLGGRLTDPAGAYPIVGAWLSTVFEGGRHAGRVRQLDAAEQP